VEAVVEAVVSEDEAAASKVSILPKDGTLNGPPKRRKKTLFFLLGVFVTSGLGVVFTRGGT
jgi:hypothetical protein